MTHTRWIQLLQEAGPDEERLFAAEHGEPWVPPQGSLLWSPLSSEVVLVVRSERIGNHLEIAVRRGVYRVVLAYGPGNFGLDPWEGTAPAIPAKTWLATLE